MTEETKRWESTEAFVATCKAIDALVTGIHVVYPNREVFLSIEDINTLQDLLLHEGYSIQKINK